VTDRLDAAVDDFSTTPWSYPGTMLRHSALLLRDGTLPRLFPRDARRLGQARVERDHEERLNYALLAANAATVDQRHLVVAVGSNASPAVIRRKFGNGRVSMTVPFVCAKVEGLEVANSAHVSNPGYIASTPFVSPGSTAEVTVSLLDEEQLRCLDESEPNYRRRWLSTTEFRLELDGGEQPAGFYVYDSAHGVIARPGEGPLPQLGQAELFELLFAECAPVAELLDTRSYQDAMLTLSERPALRDQVRAALDSARWVTPSGLADLPEGGIRYGATTSTWAGKEQPEDAFRCLTSADGLERDGEQCVAICKSDAETLGQPNHVAVSGVARIPGIESRPVIARLVARADVEPGCAGVDQVIRNALGVETQEYLRLEKIRVRRTPIFDRLVSRPHFSMMRVQAADLATLEQNVGLIDPLALGILGIESGDQVVIQGSPDENGNVTDVRIRVHATPDGPLERRERLSGGGLTSRFPSARDALAVHPDLPWIFLDASTRSRVGVGNAKLSVVRVRASRWFQVVRELRELLLVLALTLVGLASLISWQLGRWLILGIVLATVIGVTSDRLRKRLESG
jgi:hypothetical protein